MDVPGSPPDGGWGSCATEPTIHSATVQASSTQTQAGVFPAVRHRRLRRTEGIRRLVREVAPRPDQLVLPMFAVEGEGIRQPVDALPGVSRLSPDLLVDEARAAHEDMIVHAVLGGLLTPEAAAS